MKHLAALLAQASHMTLRLVFVHICFWQQRQLPQDHKTIDEQRELDSHRNMMRNALISDRNKLLAKLKYQLHLTVSLQDLTQYDAFAKEKSVLKDRSITEWPQRKARKEVSCRDFILLHGFRSCGIE